MGPARFGAADPKHAVFPVQIVQPQPADLSGPKPIPDEQHQDRPIALVDWAVAPNRRQQAHDILALHAFGTVSSAMNRGATMPAARPTRHQPRVSANKKNALR